GEKIMSKKELLHCNFCGSVFKEGDIFCNNCGANINEEKLQIDSQQIVETNQPITSEEEQPAVRILSESSLSSEPVEIQRFAYTSINTSVVVPTRVPSRGNTSNGAAVASIAITIFAVILYAIPNPFIGMFGGIPLSIIAFILAIIGLVNPNRRVLSITAFILALLSPGIWFLQFYIFWF
ncbi:MAG: hypothetical protein ACTSSH_09725, partial [Candidatus Heimdallarchaeota archaeon]